MIQEIKQSLIDSLVEEKPVLLALSGGPDSMALFALCLELTKQYSIDLHIIHLDHNYRKESAAEAKELKNLAKEHNFPFHFKKLDVQSNTRNLEDYFREERYKFFSDIYDSIQAQAILVAHHADDLAETTLKRILEGASIINLVGMKEESYMGDMKILRPMLNYRKKEVLSWLKKRDIPFFIDATNKDTQFLRARMRQELFPMIEEAFGKGIIKNLCKVSSRAADLNDYLDERVLPMFHACNENHHGIYVDLAPFYPLKKVEITHFLQKLTSSSNLCLSYDQQTRLCVLLQNQAIDKKILSGKYQLIVDRTRLFIIQNALFNIECMQGEFSPCRWQDLFEFHCRVSLPSKDYELKVVDLNTPCINNKLLRDWYSMHQVPVFLRKTVGAIVKDGIVHHDILTNQLMIQDKIMVN